MADWFKTSRDTYINLDTATYVSALYKKDEWAVWGDGGADDNVTIPKEDVMRLRRRLDAAAALEERLAKKIDDEEWREIMVDVLAALLEEKENDGQSAGED